MSAAARAPEMRSSESFPMTGRGLLVSMVGIEEEGEGEDGVGGFVKIMKKGGILRCFIREGWV